MFLSSWVNPDFTGTQYHYIRMTSGVSSMSFNAVTTNFSIGGSLTDYDTPVIQLTAAGLIYNLQYSDMDFVIYKKTSGNAYSYDAGTDVHTFSSLPVGPSSAPSTDYVLANKQYVDNTTALGGDTASRPVAPVAIVGRMYFDTTLGYPIWYNGTNWVNATGAIV